VTIIPPLTDVLGWSAAALTLLAFSCNDLVRLRYVALSANAAFIAYGLLAQLWPVLVLHFVLVPINGWRLWQALCRQPESQALRPAPAST
jgi:CRP/FNR family transcriptional regulator, cyclic AMP receptor protein